MINRILKIPTWLQEWHVRPSETEILEQDITFWKNRIAEEEAELIKNKNNLIKCQECHQYEAWQEAMEKYHKYVETSF